MFKIFWEKSITIVYTTSYNCFGYSIFLLTTRQINSFVLTWLLRRKWAELQVGQDRPAIYRQPRKLILYAADRNAAANSFDYLC